MQADEFQDATAASNPNPTGRAPGPPRPRTAAEIQEWFVEALARITEMPPEDIDVHASFEQFSLDSVTSVGLTGELEDWLGIRVDPMTVYDYPTVEALSTHLAELLAASRPQD